MKSKNIASRDPKGAEMDAEMMHSMVLDWLHDHDDEMEDLVLDGKPYIDETIHLWRQDAHDEKCTYALTAFDGMINIDYVGSR